MAPFSRARSIHSAVLAGFFLAGASLGSDGVLEINQTYATQTGCFSKDFAGHPVTIKSAGSYRLTSNLTGIGAGNDAILLTDARVTIDLNGFSIVGPSAGIGNGNGISGSSSSVDAHKHTTIKNGAIRGMRSFGINLPFAQNVRVENMTLDINAAGAIRVGDGALISSSRVSDNNGALGAAHGIETGDRSKISDNVVSGSSLDGIKCGEGCVVSNNITSGNGGSEMDIGRGAKISRNTANLNTSDGIKVSADSTVSGNTTYSNGEMGINANIACTILNNTSAHNGDNGILGAHAAHARGNVVAFNGGFGIVLAGNSGFHENVIVSNTGGTVLGGSDLGNNQCNGLLACR